MPSEVKVAGRVEEEMTRSGAGEETLNESRYFEIRGERAGSNRTDVLP